MDTRGKILTPDEAASYAQGVDANVIVGYFDVLRASTVEPLAQLARPGGRLFAIVLDGPCSILPLRARAELAAALRVIDYVIPIAADPGELIARLAPRDIVYEVPHNLIEHVLERHQEPRH